MLKIIIITTLLLLPSSTNSSSFTDDDNNNPPYHDCPSTISYSPNSTFEANLNDTLYAKFPANNFRPYANFTNATGIDSVYALYYCRGDIDMNACSQCVQAAVQEIEQKCRFTKQAIVWYEFCTLRYANYTIFSIDEDGPDEAHYNRTNIVSEPNMNPHKEVFDSVMIDAIREAAHNGTPHGFGAIEADISPYQKLRGLAQCSPFIDAARCEKCLSLALGKMDLWANTIMFLPSCQIRYDIFGQPPSPPPPPPPPLPVWKIVVGVLVPLTVIILIVVGYYWQRWRPTLPTSVTSETNSTKDENDVQNVALEIPRLQLAHFNYSQLTQMTNGFERELGKGGYGVVYYGHYSDEGKDKEVAIKMFLEKDGPTQFTNEIHVLGRICHRNLVSLVGYCEEEAKLALVYEYMSAGDLKTHLSEHSSSTLSWKARLTIACDTAQGLEYLHNGCSELIIHRDVKPANILLNQHLRAKVGDFGISKIFPAEYVSKLESTRVIGTIGYVDPQYHLTGQVNEKCDVYSFGVVLLELITGRPAIKDNASTNLVHWVTQIYERGDIAGILDPRLRQEVGDNYNNLWRATELAKRCVEYNAAHRPTMSEVVIELRECVRMESPNSSSGTTSMVIMEMMTPDATFNVSINPQAR